MVDIDPLTELTIRLSRQSLSEPDKHLAICVCISKTLPRANRVSLWKFENNRTQIRCLCLFENQTEDRDAANVVLTQQACPEYFEAILSNELVVASDARAHPHTQCFNESYFEPNDIHSLLDYIFHQDFDPIGIICCETRGKQVEWTEEEQATLKRTASITSMFYND